MQNPKDQARDLKSLGTKKTTYYTEPSKDILETFLNSQADRDYVIEFKTDEFTSLCPKTGQPDFATFHLTYVPDKLCIESKSLKLFLFSWRNTGAFMERISNEMLTAFVASCKPRAMVVHMEFAARGGITTDVFVEYIDPALGEARIDDLRAKLGI